MRTYWLYWGSRVLTGVRMSIGASNTQVIAHALDLHNRVPLTAGTGVAPFEFAEMLKHATVR